MSTPTSIKEAQERRDAAPHAMAPPPSNTNTGGFGAPSATLAIRSSYGAAACFLIGVVLQIAGNSNKQSAGVYDLGDINSMMKGWQSTRSQVGINVAAEWFDIIGSLLILPPIMFLTDLFKKNQYANLQYIIRPCFCIVSAMSVIVYVQNTGLRTWAGFMSTYIDCVGDDCRTIAPTPASDVPTASPTQRRDNPQRLLHKGELLQVMPVKIPQRTSQD